MQRKSVVFYENWYSSISKRVKTGREKLEIYEKIFKYAFYGTEPELDNCSEAIAMAFDMIQSIIDENNEKFINGKKGGRPKKEEEVEKKTSGLTSGKTSGKTNTFSISSPLITKGGVGGKEELDPKNPDAVVEEKRVYFNNETLRLFAIERFDEYVLERWWKWMVKNKQGLKLDAEFVLGHITNFQKDVEPDIQLDSVMQEWADFNIKKQNS